MKLKMGGEEGGYGYGHGDLHSPLISSTQHRNQQQLSPQIKTGTIWTATAHIITGLIGAGVLSLAWSVAQLGWVVGPLSIIIFAAVTLVATFLLCDCYRSPDPQSGRTVNPSYLKAVRHYLGPRNETVCGVLVKQVLFGTGVAYTITAAVSARGIQKSNCYHREGHQASCSYDNDDMCIVLFGFVQVLASQIPDFHNMKWLSIVAMIMSFAYSTIGVGFGFAKVIENGEIKGSIGGVPSLSTFKKTSLVFQALGDVLYSFPFVTIVLEVQDTLKFPAENQRMKRASLVSVVIATFFFLLCACFGYAAFGDDTPGNILTGFDLYEQSWLVDLANACIVVHLVGGYQVYSQPVFASVEGWFAVKFSNNRFVNDIHSVKLPLLPTLNVNLLRLCFRTGYVVSTTGIAMLFPYFNQVLGVLGALTFWPLVIYFPVEMYLVQRNIDGRKVKGVLLRAFSVACLIVSVVAFAGSVEGIVSAKAAKTK